jgi:hypothetical protein
MVLLLQMKQSIVILFTNSKTYKEYAAYFPWQAIQDKFNVIKLKSTKNAKLNTDDAKFRLSTITFKFSAFIHYCEMWKRRHTSSAYLYQANVYFGNLKDSPKVFWSLEKRFSFLEKLLIIIFSNLVLNKLIKNFNKFLFTMESLRFKKRFQNSTCFLLPYTGGLSPEWDFLVWFGNKQKIPTIGIQENWDNLSSKAFLIYHPSHFATWGKQSSFHLRIFHNFKGHIIEIGCLRIQPFYNYLQKIKSNKFYSNLADSSDKDFKILVVGTGDSGHDLTLISMLAKYNQVSNSNHKTRFLISYRPHPWVVSRTQIENVQKISRVNGLVLLPNESLHSERIDQISKANCVLSFYSTVILESLILEKTCIIPEFILEDENSNFNLVDDLPHYSGLAMVKRLKLANSFNELIRIMNEIETAPVIAPEESITNWFCADENFSEKLLRIIDSL